MLILASGDHHFERGDRWAECLRVHDWIAEQVEERRPDAFLSSGDVYEKASTPEERAAVADFFGRVANVCPVVIARGNHDRHRDLELLGRLRSRHPIIVEERAGVHVVNGIAVAAFAWPSRALITHALGDLATVETVAAAGREGLRAVFRGLGDELDRHNGPRVLLGHAHVTGARVQDQGQPLPFGETIAVGLEDLALAGADAVVLGHIHLGDQSWTHGGAPIAYTGSPFRNTFGEADPKSILALHVDRRDAMPGRHHVHVGLERIPTPATPMLLIDGAFDVTRGIIDVVEAQREAVDEYGEGAEMRLRYAVEAEHREAARAAAERMRAWLTEKRGALSVKVEERVIATTRARTPEVAEARTTAAQLEAYWRARDGAPAEERWPALVKRLGELESEAA